MSTTDSQGKEPLTRKQMREIRLTGATPVISEEEAAAAPAPVVPADPAPVVPEPVASEPVEPEPVVEAAAPAASAASSERAPLTRRQAREQERIRTASVPVIPTADEPALAAQAEPAHEQGVPTEEAEQELVSEVPAFAPVSAADASENTAADADAVPEAAARPVVESDEAGADLTDLGVDADAIEDIEDDTATGERPTVGPAFGSGVLTQEAPAPAFTPSFDELITVGDTTGSQSIAPSALIFNPPPGEGSLSGPVAATGEVLITGTYQLPDGIGSQGHAKGVADGKDVDAVLIDGELPPASSPTPIAASSAISTSKPAGEIIRPPAPEKGNRLMLVLAITAGGLALVLAAALVAAFTMNVFG